MKKGSRPVSKRVIEAVAEQKGVDQPELESLTEVVNPDAINDLFDASNEEIIELQFEYEGVLVHINNIEEISISTLVTPSHDDLK